MENYFEVRAIRSVGDVAAVHTFQNMKEARTTANELSKNPGFRGVWINAYHIFNRRYPKHDYGRRVLFVKNECLLPVHVVRQKSV